MDISCQNAPDGAVRDPAPWYIRRGDDDYMSPVIKSVHKRQSCATRLYHVSHDMFTFRGDGVDFVKKDNARGMLFRSSNICRSRASLSP